VVDIGPELIDPCGVNANQLRQCGLH
jgi:hypothetical protein